jgi:hypothetical protein
MDNILIYSAAEIDVSLDDPKMKAQLADLGVCRRR